MQYSQIILDFINNKGVSFYKLAKDTGISESTFSKWKSKPTSDISFVIVEKISNYFNVSPYYLLTGETTQPKDLTKDELELLDFYRKLDAPKQHEFKGELKGYIRAKSEGV